MHEMMSSQLNIDSEISVLWQLHEKDDSAQ